ncbi:MAG: 4-alpha-glucanotransferase [bacterium]
MQKRGSGILNHITSLDSDYGIGDLGPGAYDFADFLCKAGQSYWQILPLTPTDPLHGNSPYNSISVFGSNYLLISPELLVRDGMLENKQIMPTPELAHGRVNYSAVIKYKQSLFAAAFKNFNGNHDEYRKFCYENSCWLDDYALFVSCKSHFKGGLWVTWPEKLRNREKSEMDVMGERLGSDIEMVKFLEFVFYKQWFELKNYCNSRGIRIIGDIPIYVSHDSADVWSFPSNFKLNAESMPEYIAGVPPDYFSKTGQRWGNPVYNWESMRQTGYNWWVQRIRHNLNLYDLARIDHFRGLVAYWEIPAQEKTAENGYWVNAPISDFLNILLNQLKSLPIIAEDLGTITPDVWEVMNRYSIPGMKVLLFAFGEDNPMHPYLPHTYGRNCLVYTGTHDNNTIRGWFGTEASPEEKKRLFDYCGRKLTPESVSWELIKIAMSSVADTVITPLQDILNLNEQARMNKPGTLKDNWHWRVKKEDINDSIVQKLRKATEIYGRANG